MRRGVLNKFNRGEIDPRAMLRLDVEKILDSCETMDNFIPMRLGPMQYRPGSLHVGLINGPTYLVPFIAKANDTAIMEFSSTDLRVWVDDEVITRDASNLIIANGGFTSDIVGWTDASGAGSVAGWASAYSGSAFLTGTGTTSGKLWQTLSNSGSYLGEETAITITVFEAPVEVSIGETGVDSDEIFSGTLGVGTHSLVIIPTTGLPTITLSNSADYRTHIGQVTIEAAGEMSLPLPETITTLSSIRYSQSADVVYVSTLSTPQFKVERRGVMSWSIVDYQSNDGPFGLINNTDITLQASALSGNATLTASRNLFTADSIGEIYKLTSAGQVVTEDVTTDDDGTNSIRVTGVEDARIFTLTRSGTWSGTVTLQRSTDNLVWQDIEDYTGNGSKTYNDKLDNAILYYRLWVKTGDYTSGTIVLDMVYTAGSIDGTCRVVRYLTPTTVEVIVLEDFGSTEVTRDWSVGEWSETAGYPSSVSLYEGRLWWAGLTKLWSSVSDEFESFDTTLEGDSAAIRRTVGFGPVDNVDWLAPSSRLIMGIASDEISVRSSSFGEVLTPENTNLKSGSTRGVAPLEPLKVDDSIVYVQRSGEKIIASDYNANNDGHIGSDLMIMNPSICKNAEGIKRIVVSREPETRIYVLMNDGTLRLWLTEPTEEVTAWSRITTAVGTYEDIVVLPGDGEDRVYVHVVRDGVRRMEKFALMDEYTTVPADAAIQYTSPGLTITGLSTLEGRTVMVWADSADRGSYTVTGGQITVDAEYTDVTVGIRYNADYKSMRVSGYVKGSVVGRRKRIVDTSITALDLWYPSFTIGPDFDNLKPLPSQTYNLDPSVLIEKYDQFPFEFESEEEIDPRICIRARGPCTIMALTYGVVQDGDKGDDPQ